MSGYWEKPNLWADWPSVHGSASLYALRDFGSKPGEPIRISSRSIGFGANIDEKLRFSVRVAGKRITMEEARELCGL